MHNLNLSFQNCSYNSINKSFLFLINMQTFIKLLIYYRLKIKKEPFIISCSYSSGSLTHHNHFFIR
jgi:hypothetical protein